MALALDSRYIAIDPRYTVEVRPHRVDTRRSPLESVPRLSMAPTQHLSHDVYLRRRLVAGLAVLAVVIAACLGIRTLASRGDATAAIPTVTPLSAVSSSTQINGMDVTAAFAQGEDFYVVQSGDTLWSIASSLTDGNLRQFVRTLTKLNGGASIDVGQRLIIPVK